MNNTKKNKNVTTYSRTVRALALITAGLLVASMIAPIVGGK